MPSERQPSERQDSQDSAERVEAAADELYGVAPDDFVPVRDELVGEAKDAGDRDAAKAIGRLRRPTQAAWLSNLLARERGDQLDALLDLAGSLSSAQRSLDGPQLRQLSAQRSKLVGAMAKEARRIAAADGHRITETVERDLRGILDAALADPDIADEVRSGRLTRTVTWSGFGPDSGEATLGGWGTPREGSPAREPRERRTPRAPRRPAPGRPGHGLPGVEPRARGRRPGAPADEDESAAGDSAEVGSGPGAEPDAGPGAAAGADDEPGAADREQAERERAERARAEREQAERERAERERREREAARVEAEQVVEQARRASGAAADTHEDTAAALRDAESDRDEATALVDRLSAELERAREARSAAAAAVKDAAQAEREASRAARDAAATLARAEARLAELRD